MSVIYFSNRELKSIYMKLCDIVERNDFAVNISKEALRRFIARLGLCNRLAYEFTYLNGKAKIKLDIPDFETVESDEMSMKELVEKLSLLEYNFATNSGKCFMDEKDKELLEKIVYSLKWRYIRHLEWELKNKP